MTNRFVNFVKISVLTTILTLTFQNVHAATGPNILGGNEAEGDMLEVTITENGGVVPRKWGLNFGSTDVFDWQRIYYSIANGNGFSLWNESTCLMQGGYFTAVGSRTITLSEKATGADGSESITRTWTGTGGTANGIVVVETFRLYKGANFYVRTVEIQNNSGVNLENVRLYLGGDVYFSGGDSSYGDINFADGAVYCYREAQIGIITMRGINPLPTFYHAAHYSTNGRDRVTIGNNLGNFSHPVSSGLNTIDTGYYLQWGDRNDGNNAINIPYGDSFTIETMEAFNNQGSLQITSSGVRAAPASSLVSYNFTMYNMLFDAFSDENLAIELSAASQNGWLASVNPVLTAATW